MSKAAIPSSPVDQAKDSYRQGIECSRTGKAAEAINFFTQAIQFNNNYPAAYTALSTAFNELGRKDEALIAEQKASELKPGGALFYYYRGKDALFKGNNADALTAFKKATALIENTDHSKEIINFINILFSPEERVWIKKLVVLNDDISRTNDELKEINKDQVEYKEVIS